MILFLDNYNITWTLRPQQFDNIYIFSANIGTNVTSRGGTENSLLID